VFEMFKRKRATEDDAPDATPATDADVAATPDSPADDASATAEDHDDVDVDVDEDDAPSAAESPRLSPSRSVASFLTDDTHIVGGVSSRGSLTVAGEVDGDVRAGALLTIMAHAEIKGDVTAKELTVRGTVRGNVKASGRLTIAATGCVHGDVSAGSVVVEDGGTLDGRCHMGAKG
jgi:cytoskeletal protein CcmA (bactofilin family)